MVGLKREKGCTCNLGYLLLGAVLFSVALYILVMGFSAQFTSGAGYSAVLPWYFVGIVLFKAAKLTMWKSHGMCPVHGMYGKRR